MKKRMFIKQNKFILLIALLLVVIISGYFFSVKAFKSQYKGQIGKYNASGESEILTFDPHVEGTPTFTTEAGTTAFSQNLFIKTKDSEGRVSWEPADLTGYTVSSTDTQVATIEIRGNAEVVITPGSKAGTATLTATNSSKTLTASLIITVTPENPPQSIEIVKYPSKRAFEVNEKISNIGGDIQFKVIFKDGTSSPIWTADWKENIQTSMGHVEKLSGGKEKLDSWEIIKFF